MLTLRNISFSYPASTFKLNVEALELTAGERLAVIGPSGSGKTTLLNLIAGIYLPESGSIEFQKERVDQMSDGARRNMRISAMGFVFQDFKLIEYLTVQDNILLPNRINSAVKLDGASRSQVHEIATEMGIGDKLPKYPDKLSHGERQRVAICRALLHKPKLILADEPTGNLDPANKKHIMDMLFGYVKSNNASLITVTHDHELLDSFDRIVDFQTFTSHAG